MGLALHESFARSAKLFDVETMMAENLDGLCEAVSSIIHSLSLKSVVMAGLSDNAAAILAERLARGGLDVHILDLLPGEAALELAETSEAGIVLSEAGVAETGTVIITDGGAPMLASTLPPVLIVILEEEKILPSYSDLSGLMRRMSGEHGSIHLITGPSGTADIELAFVKGVHGPREVYVVIYRGARLGRP